MEAYQQGRDLRVLTLSLDGESFAIETDRVYEVLDVAPMTAVPGSGESFLGLINVRGRVIPVIDLRRRLLGAGHSAPQTEDTRVVVGEVMVKGERTLVGLLADRVQDVVDLPAADLQATPRLGLTGRPDYIAAVGKCGRDFIAVMDLDKALAGDPTA